MSVSKKRFIVVAMPRSGSTLVQTALDSHPDVSCLYEPFHPSDPFDGEEHILARIGVVWDYDKKPVVGCKTIVEHHMLDGGVRDYRPLWEVIDELFPDMKHIFIQRTDVVSQAISYCRAMEVGWHSYVDLEKNECLCTLQPDEVVAAIRWLREQEKFIGKLLDKRGRDMMMLSYVDCVNRTEKVLKQVQMFLGVTPQELTPKTRVQRDRPWTELIENYAQVIDAVSTTDDVKDSLDTHREEECF